MPWAGGRRRRGGAVGPNPTDIAIAWASGFAGGNIPHGTAADTTIGTISGADPQNDSLTFSEVTDSTNTFTIATTALKLTSQVAYDGAGDDARAITIRATDTGANTYDETFTAYVLADDGAVDPGAYDSGTLVLSNGGKTVTKIGGSTAKGAIHNKNHAGKMQFEFEIVAKATTAAVGLATSDVPTTGFPDGLTGNSVLYRSDGTIWKDGSQVASGYPTWGTGDVVIGAFDATTREVWFGVDGTFEGSPSAGTGEATTATAGTYRLAVFLYDTADAIAIRDTEAALGTALQSGFTSVEGLPYTPPLDSVSAARAYSIRKLRTAYSGNCLRVRRLSDNAEEDFGFDGDGLLDYGAILSWAGSADLRVSTWYDQSGNGQNAIANNRPLLRDSSAWYQYGGFNGIYFNTFATMGFTSITTGAYALAGVVNIINNGNVRTIAAGFSGGGVGFAVETDERIKVTRIAVANDLYSGSSAPTGLSQVYFAASNGAQEVRLNNSAATSTLAVSYGGDLATIGGVSGGGGFTYESGMLELIFFSSIPSGTSRDAVNLNQKTYFGTP